MPSIEWRHSFPNTSATVIVDTRRQGRAPSLRLQDDLTTSKFETELGKYRSELDQLPVSPGSSSRALPQALLWTLGFLRQASPDDHQPSDQGLVDAAFACARQLVATHVRELTRKEDAKQEHARCVFAEQIVAQVARKAPLKFRDLARSFGNQRKERFVPVVDTLVEMGVLVRDIQGSFNLGPVELEDVAHDKALTCDGLRASAMAGKPRRSTHAQ